MKQKKQIVYHLCQTPVYKLQYTYAYFSRGADAFFF